MNKSPLPLQRIGSPPRLAFEIVGAEAVRFAAAPTIAFALRVEADKPVRSLSLNAQLRLDVARRPYDADTQARLLDLFGEPGRWGDTLRNLLWTQTTLTVPGFDEAAETQLHVPVTYDFEVASAKYFHGLQDGEAPVEFLFSGTVFYGGDDGSLLAGQVSWESEARYSLPVSVWKQAVEHHFPGSAWLRVRRDVFDRLYAHRARHSLPTWEAVIDDLLAGRD